MKRLLLPLLILLISSCSVFEDGPAISFRSEEARWQGKWRLTYFTVDGTDSLNYYNDKLNSECDFTFYKSSDISSNAGFQIDWGSYHVTGYHKGINDDHFTVFNFYEGNSSGSSHPLWFMKYPLPTADGAVKWTVTRLKYKEMWMEMEVNEKQYELRMENTSKF